MLLVGLFNIYEKKVKHQTNDVIIQVEMIIMLKEKIEKAESSSKAKAKKLKKLLEKLTRGTDVSYI